MTRESILQELQNSVPEFALNPEWVEESLGFPAIADFARYVRSEAEVGQWDEVRKSMQFIERALTEGDNYVCDLVFEFLEALDSWDAIEIVKEYFGSKTLAMWKDELSNRR